MMQRAALREERALSFETYTSDGGRASAWDVPGDAPGLRGRRLGFGYAREVVAYFSRFPERVSERLLEAIVLEPAFATEKRRAIREGFTGGLTAAAVATWPRPLLESRQHPPPFEGPYGRFVWHIGTFGRAVADPAWQVSRGTAFARAWLVHVRSDPLAAAVNWLDRIVTAEAFRDEKWSGCRSAFLREVQIVLRTP